MELHLSLEVGLADCPGLLVIPSGLIIQCMTVEIISEPVSVSHIRTLAQQSFGDMVKGVVDVRRKVMALGGELHSDEESFLLDDGSSQGDLWGINIYPGEKGDDWIEFDSMINVRPSANNRSRDVEDQSLRTLIRSIVTELVTR